MGVLSYKSEEPTNREAANISFDVPDDMNINEFKIMCVRMASSMGYHANSISKTFGELDYETNSDKDFKKFLHSINVTTGSLTL
jgi:hypothetical protein|tara:strand:- start:559 stop:810 length:252 start_codon:yes stop_codon:yes gene_type:complete